MSHPLFEKHRELIEQACKAARTRGYWSPFNEMPSPKTYGENAAAEGKAAFDALLGKNFELDQVAQKGWHGSEVSPYGIELNIQYPVCDIDALVDAGEAAMQSWQAIGNEARIGISTEMLTRLNQESFAIATAVMMTSGQGWMMAFQAGGPHAQDRGLESVTYAYLEQSVIPTETIWEKPQGKNPALVMKKHFEIVGRGVGVVVGCGTFPTWNTYPGLFATLATGNAVIVKPHSNAILPAAMTVKILREILRENQLDPNLVQLCVTPDRADTQKLVKHEKVPANGIETDAGHKSYDDVCNDLAQAISGFLAKPEVAFAVLGAIQSKDSAERVDQANNGTFGKVVLASQKLENPEFPNADVRTPVLVACDANDPNTYQVERFGPISFIVKVADTQAAIALSEQVTREHGALTVGIYSTSEEVIDTMVRATWRSKVALSINLTGGVFVNQSAAFSDYHGTGGNPSANASYADSAFVANRFRVVQRRYHV